MARKFDVPEYYRSKIISTVKEARRLDDPRKKDLSPSILDFGQVQYLIARHFGFCYGVENAIEIAYNAIEENPGKRIFLLSEMIHNPSVNDDLRRRGIAFLRTTDGRQLIPFDDLRSDDLVIIPAFGTTVEVRQTLEAHGIDTQTYNTTCPFVEKVWKRSEQIGRDEHTIVIHGKRTHEETRATFSQARKHAAVVVVRDIEEARLLASVIDGTAAPEDFASWFNGKTSDGFDPAKDLQRIGVVNQTTMLATETQEIASLLREAIVRRDGSEAALVNFADTSDTLCYATNENQNATYALLEEQADVAIVVGGYNSSNTSHLVELCSEKMPTFFVQDAREIHSLDRIQHFLVEEGKLTITTDWLPTKRPVRIVLTAGASCPDAMLEDVLVRINNWIPPERAIDDVLKPFSNGLLVA
ncbi:MAG: 4-hydroxy-3-methylbut-2-enyl diphosphate reductase [Rhodothermales bacterium]|nr:4-hydroxy-3-methylbut-2-enyl diphosphate reductase [Rhodothermales bacterium]